MPAPPNNPSDARLDSGVNGSPVDKSSSQSQIPTHLYSRLPAHHLLPDGTPDYLRLILLSQTYSPPLNMKETPLTKAVNLSARLGNEIWLKREDMQEVFSFKIRGAYNFMSGLSEEERWKGVVTCSAGNHAQGVALAGFKLGIPCTIVMPIATPTIKWLNVERLGAKVVLHGDDFDQAKAECLRLTKQYSLTYVPPYDDPLVIAGQGTIAMEILRQVPSPDTLDGIFGSVGGGGHVAGLCAYAKRVAQPSLKIVGVETVDGDAMKRSIAKGERVLLDEVGPFSDGTAVKIVGEECFRICKDNLDAIQLCTNDEICAAMKDIFEETRTVPEPSGALSLAGLKSYIVKNQLQGAGKRFVAVVSGANVNFGRLKFVAERADLGERREVLMSVTIPEKPGSFLKFHSHIHPRTVTEFSYRYPASPSEQASIFTSFLLGSKSASGPSPSERKTAVDGIVAALQEDGMHAWDLSEDEMSKDHARYLIGGRVVVPDERIFRFEFPERPNALHKFLHNLHAAKSDKPWNISLFHYRNHGSDLGKVLIGIQVPTQDQAAFNVFLQELAYPFTEETENRVYKKYLRA